MNDNFNVKIQAGNLCDALHRNINDNFRSVSFDIDDNGSVQVRIILSQRSEVEEEYIEDIMVEFVALQQTDCVTEPDIQVSDDELPLKYIVYQI